MKKSNPALRPSPVDGQARRNNAQHPLRRAASKLARTLKKLPLSYRIGLGAFCVLLLMLLLTLTLAFLIKHGVPIHPPNGVIRAFILFLSADTILCMSSMLIGMAALSFTPRSEHDKSLFDATARAAYRRADENAIIWTPETSSNIRLGAEDDAAILSKSVCFSCLFLLLWLCIWLILFGRHWIASGWPENMGFSSVFPLAVTAFLSIRATRLLHRLYDAVRCFHTRFISAGDRNHG